jgi:O-antigen ligase
MNSAGKLAGRTSAIMKKQNITDHQHSNNLAQRKTKGSFICFLAWIFVLIARPQDYLTFLMPLRPVISMTVLTLVLMLIERIRVPREIVKLHEVRFALLFYSIMVIGIPFAVHLGVAFSSVFITFLSTLIFFFVAIIQLQSIKSINAAARVVAMSILFSGLLYVIDVLIFGSGGFRADASQTYDPNDIAMVFVTYIPICIYVFLSAKGLIIKAISAGAALAATTGIMLSRSRGGALSMAMIICVMLLARIPQWKKGMKIATVVILAVVFFFFFSSVERRFENMEDDYNLTSEGGRLHVWEQNLDILAQRPVFGVGASCSSIALGFMRAREGGLQAWQVTHSSIIQILVETGIPGFIVFALLNIFAILNLRRIRRSRGHPLSLIAFFVELSLYGFWVSGFFLSHGYSSNLYFLLALSAALRYLDKYKPELIGYNRQAPRRHKRGTESI